MNGILYDTELADEISAKFPLTVSLGGYGGREYYGDVAKGSRPTKKAKVNWHL